MMKLSHIHSIVCAALAAALTMITSTSCEDIYDYLEPCPHGVNLRFVYDYNMEYANSFHKKVDCITLYIYDEQGRFLSTVTETSEALADENYRMPIELEHGNYRMVAYGGLACPEHSFSMVETPATRTSLYADRQVKMDDGELGTKLHDLYFGAQDITVEGDRYVEATLYLMKNTNNIRIMLQQVNCEPTLTDENFSFAITDDNTLFAHDNTLLPNGEVTYTPWTQGTVSAGTTGEGDNATEARVCYAEFSTSRLVRATNAPHLVVTNRLNGVEVVNIPLINYLLLLKSELYADMPAQEFLDRESDWSLLFFLDEGGNWVRTRIVINDWVVRLNNAEM